MAKKIVEEDDQILTLNSLPIFFYFNIKEYEGETIILELEVIKFLILDWRYKLNILLSSKD